ncbi:ATP-binding protein [Escherichia coli]|uniref:ATP-binding protein n=1 Tax=Escherichia coli TaxID=562 RepID=UPI00129412B6|nr:ATP-binding protein [Escherichia coli]EES0517238.1 ATP-binding protein [Escherichia coli]EGM2631365.1 ATP-binding protein [Escherichia coli]MQR60535.1 ATP-binding protein [Escherichia coli]
MYKQATELMLNFKDRILIKGEEDTGKSTLLTEIRISDSDSRYYNFKTLNSAGYNRLCDENIDNFDFLNTPEKTLILDGVRLCEKKMTSKVIRLIKQARKYHKRLVVAADSCESEFIELLFDGVIALHFNSDRERSCNVYTPSRCRNTDNISPYK